MRAAVWGHVEVVTKLAELGVDLAATDKVRTVISFLLLRRTLVYYVLLSMVFCVLVYSLIRKE